MSRPIDDLEREIDAMRERIEAQAAHMEVLKREVLKLKECMLVSQENERHHYRPVVTRIDRFSNPPPPIPEILKNGPSRRNDFGREDISHLPAEYLSQCYIEMDVVGLMETLLFDSDHIENNTIRMVDDITSTNTAMMDTWRNGSWHAVTREDDVITDLIRAAYRIMSQHARKHQESIVKRLGYDLDAFEDLKEFYERLYDDDDANRMHQSIKNELLDLIRTFSTQP